MWPHRESIKMENILLKNNCISIQATCILYIIEFHVRNFPNQSRQGSGAQGICLTRMKNNQLIFHIQLQCSRFLCVQLRCCHLEYNISSHIHSIKQLSIHIQLTLLSASADLHSILINLIDLKAEIYSYFVCFGTAAAATAVAKAHPSHTSPHCLISLRLI